MKSSFTVLGASVVGFVGVVAVYHGKTPSAKQSLASLGSASTTTTTKSNSAAASTTTTAVTPTTIATGVRSATGKTENYGYGDLAVTVTVNGSKITSISVSTLQTLESYSQGLAQQVIPILHREAISAQSAQISAISGATYTSEAYAYSLQSALVSLGLK